MHSLFITFDTEDFISENSIPGLKSTLELLKKHELTALFFITGNMAEKLCDFPDVVDLLREHQIGYHTSSHSIHPTVFEFTDVPSYEEAYQISIMRETSHIDPLSGKVEGKGGIHALRSLFQKKQIVAFRAPGYCWSPPHLEALKTLGITYDFSTNFSAKPVCFKGITFYPYTFMVSNWQGGIVQHASLQRFTLARETLVLTVHPSKMVNQLDWDLIFYFKHANSGLNPSSLAQPPARSPTEIAFIFHKFDLLLRHIRALQKIHFLKVTPALKPTNITLYPTLLIAKKSYAFSVAWTKGFGYQPKFLYKHFVQFFQPNSTFTLADNSSVTAS